MSQVRWAGSEDTIQHITDPPSRSKVSNSEAAAATAIIRRAWRRWLARRAGPLLWSRNESNNPYDFFSGDPVTDIPLGEIVSFVDSGKGYIMDIKSANSLLEHASRTGETPLNPFNRATLPSAFLRRVALHRPWVKGKTVAPKGWGGLVAMTEEQKLSLAITDVFRDIEDLGYYTDPSWFLSLERMELTRLYIELADIWFHRAGLSVAQRNRIVPPPTEAFPMAVRGALLMPKRGLQPLLLRTCRALVSASSERSDRQTGVMYVLGSLAMVSRGCATAYPWLVDMFAPGATRVVGGELVLTHPGILIY